jgi:hypothetical protein
VALGQARIDRLSVGGFTLATDALVVDFATTNASRKAYGAAVCDGVLGGHFCQRYAAVIDYAQPKLYLLDPARK